jgi:hypothetical protein
MNKRTLLLAISAIVAVAVIGGGALTTWNSTDLASGPSQNAVGAFKSVAVVNAEQPGSIKSKLIPAHQQAGEGKGDAATKASPPTAGVFAKIRSLSPKHTAILIVTVTLLISLIAVAVALGVVYGPGLINGDSSAVSPGDTHKKPLQPADPDQPTTPAIVEEKESQTLSEKVWRILEPVTAFFNSGDGAWPMFVGVGGVLLISAITITTIYLTCRSTSSPIAPTFKQLLKHPGIIVFLVIVSLICLSIITGSIITAVDQELGAQIVLLPLFVVFCAIQSVSVVFGGVPMVAIALGVGTMLVVGAGLVFCYYRAGDQTKKGDEGKGHSVYKRMLLALKRLSSGSTYAAPGHTLFVLASTVLVVVCAIGTFVAAWFTELWPLGVIAFGLAIFIFFIPRIVKSVKDFVGKEGEKDAKEEKEDDDDEGDEHDPNDAV